MSFLFFLILLINTKDYTLSIALYNLVTDDPLFELQGGRRRGQQASLMLLMNCL